jgi:O-antigen/teichoic acid export membrane protein
MRLSVVFGRAAVTTLGTSSLIQALNAVTGLILARGLVPEARGALAAVLLWPLILAAVGSLGVPEATTYYAARDRDATARIASTAVILGLLQSIVLVGAGAVVLPFVLGRYDSKTLATAYAFLLVIPLSLTVLCLLGVINGMHRFTAFNLLRLLYIAACAVGLGALAITGRLTVRGAAEVYLGAHVLTLALALLVLSQSCRLRATFDRGLARRVLGFGLKSHLSNVSSLFNERLDQLVISVVLAPASLGLYVIAVTMSSVAALLGNSLSLVTLPLVSRLAPGPDRARFVTRLTGLTFGVSALAALPLIVMTPYLIDVLFGSRYVPAADAARVLLVAGAVFGTSRVLAAVLKGTGHPGQSAIGEAAGLAVTVGALAALLPAFGLVGAAVASLAAYVTASAYMGFSTMRILRREDIAISRADAAEGAPA